MKPDEVIARLEEAGSSLLALPVRCWSTRGKVAAMMSDLEARGETRERQIRLDQAPRQVTRMDEALGWITLIPLHRYAHRRVVGARCLVSPLTSRHLYSWRRIGELLGVDHKTVQRWHREGIAFIVKGLSDAGSGVATQGGGRSARAGDGVAAVPGGTPTQTT